MTDRYATLTVALEHDIRVDDADYLINAIKAIRGVAGVTGHVNNYSVYTAQERIRREWGRKIFDFTRELMWGDEKP